MNSIDQTITLGQIRRLTDIANQLLTIAQTAKTDLNEAIANDDADAYRQNEIDIIDETNDLWTELGDWIAANESEEE